jgi:Mg2+-importing ATPase
MAEQGRHTDRPGAAFWAEDEAALSARLGSSADGLSSDEAAARLDTVGPNAVEGGSEETILRLLVRQVANPLVLILVFAGSVSLVLAEWIDAVIVLAVVLGSSILGFVQEYRAAAAVADLKRRLALTSRVIRDGREQVVASDAVVPGDVVLLSAGNLVPADGRVLSAQDFLVTEAAITGESFPIEKRPGVVAADAAPGARTNSVFLGSSVRSGTARVLVVETGARTQFGTIAARVRARAPETDFGRGVRRFGMMLVRMMFAIVLAVLAVNLVLGRPVLDTLMFAVALAVGLSPELLPAIVSVTLSAGARAMARRGVIVRRLDAIETLGSVDVLCTDKTGTLTVGRVVLDQATDPFGSPSDRVLRAAFLNASLETGIANPLDEAIMAAGRASALDLGDPVKVDEIPYDFSRRRLTVVVAGADTDSRSMVTKGAVTEVLDVCVDVDTAEGPVPIDAPRRAAIDDWCRARGGEGRRVLALATRSVATKADYDRSDETAMTLLGFLVFSDPPKPDAAAAITSLAGLGIRTKVITGDNRYVAAHVAEGVGLDPRALLTGDALAGLKDEALWHLAPRTDIFAEIDPQQKERIVRALQRTGHVVGYLGDGINDAPALHAADVGISVDGAADVARDSADIVLTRPDLDVLRSGVEDGRRTFANTLKYITITTSANFGNMVSMALASPFLPFLPLLAKQILLNNFLSDVPSLAISTDRVDAAAVSRPLRWDVAAIRRFMVVFGLVSSVFDLFTFAFLLAVVDADEPTFHTSWFVVSLLTELAVVLVLRTEGPALRSRPSALLLWSTLAIMVITPMIAYLGPLSGMFGFVPLSAADMAALLAIVLAYIAVTEAVKRRYYRAVRAGPSA